MRLPIDYIQEGARIMSEQHYAETGERLDMRTAEYSVGRWDDGRRFLRLSFDGGYWWELAFGPEADALMDAADAAEDAEAATATRH